MGCSSPWVGTSGACELLTTMRSYGYLSPLTHWPPVIGVVQTLGTGLSALSLLLHVTWPPMVCMSVAAMASRMVALSSTLVVRFSASTTTSKMA